MANSHEDMAHMQVCLVEVLLLCVFKRMMRAGVMVGNEQWPCVRGSFLLHLLQFAGVEVDFCTKWSISCGVGLASS